MCFCFQWNQIGHIKANCPLMTPIGAIKDPTHATLRITDGQQGKVEAPWSKGQAFQLMAEEEREVMVYQVSSLRKSIIGLVHTRSALQASRLVSNECKFIYIIWKYWTHILGNMKRKCYETNIINKERKRDMTAYRPDNR